MFTDVESPNVAAQIGSSEISAWLDMYAAVRSDFGRRFQLEIMQTRGLALTGWQTIPLVRFNCVMNPGIGAIARGQ